MISIVVIIIFLFLSPILIWVITHLEINNVQRFKPKLSVRELIIPVDANGSSPEFPSRGWPQHLAGTRFAVLSDLHYDGDGARTLDVRLLDAAIDQINAAEVDGIFILGDVIQKNVAHVQRLSEHYLQRLVARRWPTFAILGNHDDPVHVRQALETVGIKVLENETFALAPDVLLAGFGDVGRRRFHPERCMSDEISESTRVIALSHHPETALALSRWPIDLQLSGHTHGSQVQLPFFGSPLPLISSLFDLLPGVIRERLRFMGFLHVLKHHWEYLLGTHFVPTSTSSIDHPGHILDINTGLGSHFGIRIGLSPEILYLKFV